MSDTEEKQLPTEEEIQRKRGRFISAANSKAEIKQHRHIKQLI